MLGLPRRRSFADLCVLCVLGQRGINALGGTFSELGFLWKVWGEQHRTRNTEAAVS